jgi:hypothetical protein
MSELNISTNIDQFIAQSIQLVIEKKSIFELNKRFYLINYNLFIFFRLSMDFSLQ